MTSKIFEKGIALRIYCFLLLLSSLVVNAQTAEIASLQKSLSKTKDSATYVDKLNRIAMLMQMKSPDSCFVYGSKAKNIARRNNYNKGTADANNVMAIALSVKGVQHEGMKLFNEALSSYNKLADTANIVQVYMNMSILFASLEDRNNMNLYSNKAMQLGNKIPNDSIMSIVYSNYVLANQNISQDSLKYYRNKSNIIASKYQDKKVLMINRLDEVSKFVREKNREVALPILTSILFEARKLGIEYAELMALGSLSSLYNDEPEIALSYSEEALAGAKAGGYSYVAPLILQEMLHYAEVLNDSSKQIEIAKKLVAATSLQQRQLQLFFGDYMNFTDIQEKNISLEKQSAADNKYIALLYTFLVICVLLIIAIILLYKNARKISQRKTEYNREITDKNKKLQEADDFKNRLVSILAHDFRSPMISTLYLVDILSTETDLSASDKNELYDTIKDDVNKILNKFDMTLQWITQQLNGYKVHIIKLQIGNLINDVIQNFELQSQKKQITIENNIPLNTTIISDKEMLQFINRNIISNAIKYSPPHGKITIDIAQENENWIISFADQGRGLDPKTRETLFSVGSLSGATNDGAGIALSMCREFITKLGGEINETNNADGGATFFYTVPVNQKSEEI